MADGGAAFTTRRVRAVPARATGRPRSAIVSPMTTDSWTEVADLVFTRRFEPVDITVTAVLGGGGVLVADTRCSLAEGYELRAALAALTPLPVRWIVNTHKHFDHAWGNAVFAAPRLEPPAEIWGHAAFPPMDTADPDIRAVMDWIAGDGPEWAEKMAALELRGPDHLVADRQTLDLGDRVVELSAPGRGHTDTDLALWIPDARVLVGGDMIEQSGPVAYGEDSFPMDWPATLVRVGMLTEGDAVYVPGHGDPVDHAFVMGQQEYVFEVAEQIRSLFLDGVPLAAALKAGTWPGEDAAHFGQAVSRGYAQLSGELL